MMDDPWDKTSITAGETREQNEKKICSPSPLPVSFNFPVHVNMTRKISDEAWNFYESQANLYKPSDQSLTQSKTISDPLMRF